MNKKAFSLMQHTLIPVALIAGNIALVHFIYLLAVGAYNYQLFLTIMAIILLSAGVLRANKYLLFGGIVFYSLLLI